MKRIIGAIVLFIIAYAMLTLISWDYNTTHWSFAAVIALSIVGIVSCAIIIDEIT